jgi:hypothetical protein
MGSFILVQYKTFGREERDGGMSTNLVYRPDQQFRDELERMRKIKLGRKSTSHVGFRLHPGCRYLKICKPISSLDHSPQQLVSGMYLPVEYYDLLAESDAIRGPRGGIALSYDNVPRHVSNNLFVSLVHGGWIGSHGATTKRLTDLVVDGLRAKHSMTVAAVSITDGPDDD